MTLICQRNYNPFWFVCVIRVSDVAIHQLEERRAVSVRHHGISSRQGSEVTRIIGKLNRDDREVWRVASGRQIKNLTTTISSASAMDEAVEIYGRALKRLANR
jgi:hypothetical protein